MKTGPLGVPGVSIGKYSVPDHGWWWLWFFETLKKIFKGHNQTQCLHWGLRNTVQRIPGLCMGKTMTSDHLFYFQQL